MKRVTLSTTGAFLTTAAFALGGLVACGDDAADGVVTGVTIDIYGPNDNRATATCGELAASCGFPASQYTEIRDLRFRAFQGLKKGATTTADFDDGSVELPASDYGDNNWIAVEALNSAGAVVASGGTSRRFSVAPNQDVGTLRIFTALPSVFTRAFRFDEIGGSPTVDQSVPSDLELGQGRAGFAMTQLADGRYLVSGGAQVAIQDGNVVFGEFFDTLEVYDPADGSWLAVLRPGCTAGSLSDCATRLAQPKAFHTASLLPDGRVVVVGGLESREIAPGQPRIPLPLNVVEVITINPDASGSVTALPPAPAGRALHTASTLRDGSIAIIGGITASFTQPGYLTSVDRILPGPTPTYQPLAANLTNARALHTAVNFDANDHGIIVSGGRNQTSVVATSEVVFLQGGELLTEAFNVVPGSVDLLTPRFGHVAVSYACPGGRPPRMAVVGGFAAVDPAATNVFGGSNPVALVEVYEPRSLTDSGFYEFFRVPEAVLAAGRAYPVAVPLPGSADLLVAGGLTGAGVANSAERLVNLDWNACDFSGAGNRADVPNGMTSPRAMAQAVSLPSLFALVVGGTNATQSLATAEFYNPNDYALIP